MTAAARDEVSPSIVGGMGAAGFFEVITVGGWPGKVMMSVVPVKKKLIVLTELAAVNFMAGLVAALEIHQGFLVLAVGVPIVCGLAMFTVKCPACGYPRPRCVLSARPDR